MFEVLSTLLKYIFITIIYLFIFGIIRLIYMDIKLMNSIKSDPEGQLPYLKLINRRDSLDFKIEESYVVDGSMMIGRSLKNSISIQDPYLSKEHALLNCKDGVCFLHDSGSKNGTFVNGMQLGSEGVKLKNGDRLHIGQLEFLYVKNVK